MFLMHLDSIGYRLLRLIVLLRKGPDRNLFTVLFSGDSCKILFIRFKPKEPVPTAKKFARFKNYKHEEAATGNINFINFIVKMYRIIFL